MGQTHFLLQERIKAWSLLALVVRCRTGSQETLPVLLSSHIALGRSPVLSDLLSPRSESGGAVALVGASSFATQRNKR